MNEYEITVDITTGKIKSPEIKLVRNDYNSTKLKFNFVGDSPEYTKVFQLLYPDKETVWTKDIENDEIVLVAENDQEEIVTMLTQNGRYNYEIEIYTGNSKLTVTEKGNFKARLEIEGEDVELDDRVPILDGLITTVTGLINDIDEVLEEVDNLDIDIDNSVVTITKKDGTTKSENVKGQDGKDGADGKDGFSPIATVEQTETGATITITDEQGTTSAEVENGFKEKDAVSMFSNAVYGEVSTPSKNFSINSAYGYFGAKLIQEKLEHVLKLLGESTQKTRSGKNKLNVPSSYSLTWGIYNQPISLTSGSTYTVSLNSYESTGEATRFLITLRGSENQQQYVYVNFAELETTFTCNFDVVAYDMYSQNNYANSEGITTVFNELMIELGSTKTDYEEYGVSPSSDYPSEIESIEAYNKFDISTVENKNVNISTGEESANNYWRLSDYIAVNGDEDGIATWENEATNHIIVKVLYYDASKTFTSGIASEDITDTYYRYTTPATARYIKFAYLVIYNDVPSPRTNIMICKGTEIRPYRPYGCIGIESIGRNKFDKSKATVLYGYLSAQQTWVQQSSTNLEISFLYKLTSGKQYTVTRVLGSNCNFRIQCTNTPNLTNGQSLTDIDSTGYSSAVSKTFTVPAGNEYVIFYVRNTEVLSSLTIEDCLNGFQIEYGDRATPYTPYVHNVSYIKLNHPMRSNKEKTVRDGYEWKDGVWYDAMYIRHIERAIADMNNNEDYPGWKDVDEIKADYPGVNGNLNGAGIDYMSNICIEGTQWSNDLVIANTVTSSGGFIGLNKSVINLTQTQWKEQYPDLIFKLDYGLPEPILTPITDEATIEALETIRTYTGLTEITSDIDITGSYVQDLNKVLEESGTVQDVQIAGTSIVSNKIANIPYAGNDNAGTIKTNSYYGTYCGTNGTLQALQKSYSEYSSAHNGTFIGKGTLENVITGKGLIDNTYHDDTKQDVTDNTLQTTNKTVPSAINEVNSIAKGANQALSYGNYSTMITAFNALDDDVYNVGQNIYILTLQVPDLWISSVESSSSTYTYTTDEAFVNELDTNGYVQVGYYRLSALETQKVDLANYVSFNDYATPTKAGVGRVNTNYGVAIADSTFATAPANTADIDGRNNAARNPMRNYRPIVPSIYDYALKKSITTNNQTLTSAEQNSAKVWLGISIEVYLTQAEYDALSAEEKADTTKTYNIYEEV